MSTKNDYWLLVVATFFTGVMVGAVLALLIMKLW